MAVDWYVNHQGKVRGPFTPAQLKALATTSQLTRKTLVRKGKEGKWVPAARVQGLCSGSAATPDSGSADRQTKGPTPSSEHEATPLVPDRGIRIRLVAFLLLVVFIAIGTVPWYQKAFVLLPVGLMLGTFPRVRLKGKYLERTYVVFFLAVHTQRWRLRDFVRIETDREQRITSSFGCLVLFFWLIFRVFDHLMPWLGGDYKLWLRFYDDERLLVWQGNNDDHFEANLDTLASITGLPIG